ncbi:MAG: exopolysaccharide biosynthesis protein, partial [Notoacmeibacter sp.]
MDMKTDQARPRQASTVLSGLNELFPDGRVSVGALMDALGEAGLGILLIVFALPSFIPTPGRPVGFISGTVVALIALQVMAGRHTLWLPE